ncbi:MAG: PAS domain-containing protein [Archangiaceae bacterium]|nr:PAS domain-containing protein [Archangiaceae bacterium]
MRNPSEDPERAARVERIAHVGSWEWSVETDEVWWSDELYRIYGVPPGAVRLTFDAVLARVHPDDRGRVRQAVQYATERDVAFGYAERIVRPDGTVRELETRGEVRRAPDGRPLTLVGVCHDVTERQRAYRLERSGALVLEAVATGAPLPEILGQLVGIIEEQSAGTLASILLVDPTGTRLMHGAAPSLPRAYVAAIDGGAIAAQSGSCGTAAWRKEPVYVSDISVDPLWASYRQLALGHGLLACWSTPFFSRDHRVLGTFALYYREVRSPTPRELELTARAAHLTGVAVENRQLEGQLRGLSARLESIREDERKGIAREIHDQLGQSLTALKMDLARLGRLARRPDPLPNSLVGEQATHLAAATDELLAQVRRISAELRPGVLDDLGLLAAIEWQAQEFSLRTGTPVAVHAALGDLPLPPDVATAAFRIFQEALTNITRHAHARQVDVSLERKADTLVFEVDDDGRGISSEVVHSPSALGLLGIRERAARLGGFADIAPRPGGGTSLHLELPL